MTKVVLYKEGNLLRIKPVSPAMGRLLEPLLTYERLVTEYGGKRGSQTFGIRTACYKYLPRSEPTDPLQLVATYGFRGVVQRALKAAGYQVFFKDMLPHPHPEVFEPRWAAIKGANLLTRQDEMLKALVENYCGRIDCYAGFGKTWLLHLLAKVLYKAKIHIVTRSAPLARGIHSELCGLLPNVGIVGGSKNDPQHRVVVYTADSLRKSTFDADIVVADEGHELACPKYIRELARYRNSRMFMLSASQDKRRDNVDFELNGIFGDKLMTVTYAEGQAENRVVPIKIIWKEVFLDVNPCEAMQGVEKQRWGVWRNDARNALIVEDARKYDDETQVLIVVSKIDHAVQLRYELEEFTLVYAADGMSTEDRQKFIKWNLIPADEPVLTMKRAIRLKEEFEAGTLKKVIVTSVWNRGVNFRHLAVLIRADASGSQIDDIQIPGRVSRPALPGHEKPFAIVHDYMDQFDRGQRIKAKGREKSYKKLGFTQEFPQTQSKFRQGMLEGF